MAVNKKIILFDSWTRGTAHIFRLLNSLKENNIDLLLIHVGSWGDEIGREKEEYIQGIKTRDISYYSDISSVIDIEKPDAVLFLSLDPLSHRIFNRYCKNEDVPTINLYHGVHSVFDSLSSDKAYLLNYWSYLIKRIFGGIVFVSYKYITCLIKTNAKFNSWYYFFVDMLKKIFGISIIKARDDSVADYVCVFNRFDLMHAKVKFGIHEDNIRIVGSPDIVKFQTLESSIARYSNIQKFVHKNIVYIGTGIRSTNMKLNGDEIYFDHLYHTHLYASRRGMRVIFKLHYSRIEKIKELFKAKKLNIDLCDDGNFIDILNDSCGAIIEPSTAALVPAFMGLPIYLAKYGRLENQKYGSLINDYPRSIAINSYNDFNKIENNDLIKYDATMVNSWIKDATGPLPASDMPERVVNTFKEILK
jgi:hypothetical protein